MAAPKNHAKSFFLRTEEWDELQLLAHVNGTNLHKLVCHLLRTYIVDNPLQLHEDAE